MEEDERMLIKLRGKDKHDVTLRVKKVSKIGNGRNFFYRAKRKPPRRRKLF